MDLSISSKDIPRAALAVLELNSDLKSKVRVTSGSNTTVLTVGKVQFTSPAEITRFLLREGNLLNENDGANQHQWHLIDLILAGGATSVVKQLEHKFLLGDKVSLVDYIAWGTLPPQTNDAYVALMDQTSVCTAVSALVTEYTRVQSTSNEGSGYIEGSKPSNNPLDLFKADIAKQIAKLTELDALTIFEAIDLPRTAENGDFAIAIPILRLKGNPAAIAKDLAEKFEKNDNIIGVEATGIFLNFRINTSVLIKTTLQTVCQMTDKYGNNDSGKGKTAIVEYSSPNIAKPFHAGHLRSTIIGSFIRNVHDANGWKTIAMNYLGDWGKQYGLLAIGYERYGDENKLLADPIKHLYDVYVKINEDAKSDTTGLAIHNEAREYFKKMEDGNEEALSLWRRFRELSIVKYKQVYERLNIAFDVYSGESQVGEAMNRAMDVLKKCNLLKDSDGAKVLDLSEFKLGATLVQKNDGTTLYLTRDLGAAMERHEKYKFDKMVYVVAAQQDLHLKQLFKTLELMGFDWVKKCEHVNFGMVKGMSTRKGTVIFLEDILDEARETMHEYMQKNMEKYSQMTEPEKIADEIGISAVKIQDNSARRIKDYEFDANRMYNFEGDTGPYIQYAHARLSSIERRSGVEVNYDADTSLLVEKSALNLIRIIAQYPDLVKSLIGGRNPKNQTMEGYEPCNVVTYALRLSHEIASVFKDLWVKNTEHKLAESRMLMYWAARVTLGNAMRLLGLKPQDRM